MGGVTSGLLVGVSTVSVVVSVAAVVVVSVAVVAVSITVTVMSVSGVVSVGVSSVAVSVVVSVAVASGITIIYEVDSAEILESVAVSVAVAAVSSISGSWGAWLVVGISVRTHHEGAGIIVVDTIVAAFAMILSTVAVGLGMAVTDGIVVRGSGVADNGEN